MTTAAALAAAVQAAEDRIRPLVRVTPLEPSPALSDRVGGRVYLKLENLQHTGSFKVRGAVSRLTRLGPDERRAGVVTASTGNHGLAVAYALQHLGLTGTIFLPETASPQKVAALKRTGVDIAFHGTGCEATETHARRTAEANGRTYISPYNDPLVVAGQGTIAAELVRRLDPFDAVLASVGGGGLMAGIAGTLKHHRPDVEMVGCLPENSPVMSESVRRGRIVAMETAPTLSDGTAGGIEAGAVTFDWCRQWVDRWATVTEEDIASALRLVFFEHRLVIEGAAAVAVAALLKEPSRYAGKTVVVVICGGNIDPRRFLEVVGKTDRCRPSVAVLNAGRQG